MSAQIDKICWEMEKAALKKWKTTELYVRQFSNQAEKNMADRSPGPLTGNLKESIKSEELSLGVFNLEVRTSIEDNPNPINGESAAFYGSKWNSGHFNVFLDQSIPPLLFMEEGSRDAYLELLGKLDGIWNGI
jgi:hypothetical protein